jgi:4-hydroxybenzoate polyprenyltransferase
VIVALIQALRPRQWTKNLLLFAGLLFSRQFGQPLLLIHVVVGFVAFSLFSGAVYLINDLGDLERDRMHPKKRLRPLASGRLPAGVARVALVPILVAAGAVAARLGAGFALIAALYLGMNLLYTLGLKRQVLIDVFLVAMGFVLRAIAGVQLLLPLSPETRISPWLLVCTFFGALLLGLAKRRREIANAGDGAGAQREVLNHYTPQLLDVLLTVAAAASLMSYALYTIWPGTVEKFGTEALLYTVPFVAYGIFRYLYLVHVSEHTEDPSHVLLTDRPLGLCVAAYLVAVVFILYAH